MVNKIKYYLLRYWVSISFLALAFYFYEPTQATIHCSPDYILQDTKVKTFLGLNEMTLMWILMAIAHGANACYCDIKSLLKKT